MVILESLVVWAAMLWSPLVPPMTGDMYDALVMDINRTRAMVQMVIPQTSIGNTTKSENVLFQIDRITKAIDEYNKVFARDGKEAVHLYMTYDSRPEDFQRVLSQIDAEREKAQQKILDARFKMKDIMTSAEWQALFNPKG
jgi:hypothetical protein